MGEAIVWLVNAVISLMIWFIIGSAILSWLFAFDVINYRNRFVAQLSNGLDRIVGPILAPLRRFIPPLGGIDITPIIALLVLSGIQTYLLPPFCRALYMLLGGF